MSGGAADTSRAAGAGTFNFQPGQTMWRMVGLVLAVVTMACVPPVSFGATQPDVQQQGAIPGGNRPLVTQVGQYPAFSEYTAYAQASPEYQRLYAAIERCSGKQGQGLDGMRWLVAMTPLFRVNGGGLVAGEYWRDGRTVMVGLGSERDSLLVGHEMLHDVLQLPDSTSSAPVDVHPAAIFDTACAQLVYSNRRH